MVYSSGSAVRDDVSGPGTWAFLPAQLTDGAIVAVNTGFVQNTMQDRAQQDRAVGRLVTGQPVKLTGYLRFPEAAGTLTPAENIAKRLWFTRDHLAMARALGWGEGGKTIAPFYIDLESPVPESGIPKPGPAESPSQGRSHAIRHHLVRARGRCDDCVRRVVARAAAGMTRLSLRTGNAVNVRATARLARFCSMKSTAINACWAIVLARP